MCCKEIDEYQFYIYFNQNVTFIHLLLSYPDHGHRGTVRCILDRMPVHPTVHTLQDLQSY